MPIDIEFLLARHPFLLLGREGRIESFNGGGILAAIGGGAWDIHSFSAVECALFKLANEQGGGEVAVKNKADILLFAADEAAPNVVPGVAEIDVHAVPELARRLERMFDKHFAELLPLKFGRDAERPAGNYLHALAALVLKPSFCEHDAADDLAVLSSTKSSSVKKSGWLRIM